MIIRHDLRPDATAIPKELNDACLELGGTNPYGEPMYRVIRAEDRITQAAGEWNIWAEEMPIEERGNLGIADMQKRMFQFRTLVEEAEREGFTQDEIRKITAQMNDTLDGMMQDRLRQCPRRITRGFEDVPLYPCDGWIVEKWRPASHYGAPGNWEDFKFDGLNALGRYPHNGEYEICAGPSPYLPTKRDIEDAIRMDLKKIHDRPQRPRQRVLMMLQKLEQRQQLKERERKNRIESILKDSPATLHNRLSLGAGRVIQELADKVGMKGHHGA